MPDKHGPRYRRASRQRELPAWTWLVLALVLIGIVVMIADFWAMRARP